MTQDQRFTLIISGISLLFIIVSCILGLVWKTASNASRITSEVENLSKDMTEVTRALDDHIGWHLGNRRR